MKLAGVGNVFSGADKKTDHSVVFFCFSRPGFYPDEIFQVYPAVFRRGIKKRAASAFVVLRFDVNVSFSAGQFCPLRNNRQFFLFSRYRAENDGQGLKFIVNDDETANSVKLQIRSLVCIKPRSPVLSGKRGFLGFYFCFSIILKPVSLSIFAASFLKF